MYREIGLCCALVIGLFLTNCAPPKQSPPPRKDINGVLKAHERELMALPGVVGIAVGLLPDNKTLCLKVLVVKETEELKNKIPKSLDGYPVVIEESGVIRPLSD